MSEQILPITGLTVGSISPDVIVCGDPARATRVAALLEDALMLSDQREYRIYNGRYQGRPLTVCSHGVGAPGAAIAFEELISAGAQRLIRVGTCGGMQPAIGSGALVIAGAAVQNTGYAREVLPPGYPAAADPRLTLALQASAQALGHKAHAGIVLTRDAFYSGPGGAATPDYRQMSAARVLAVEMECAVLFAVALLRGVSSGAILAVDGNVLQAAESMDTYQPHRDEVARATGAAVDIALHTLTHGPA